MQLHEFIKESNTNTTHKQYQNRFDPMNGKH